MRASPLIFVSLFLPACLLGGQTTDGETVCDLTKGNCPDPNTEGEAKQDPPPEPPAVDATQSTLTIDRSEIPADDVEFVAITVRTKAADGTLPIASDITLQITGTGHTLSAEKLRTDADGVAVFSLRAKTLAEHTITATSTSALGTVSLTAAATVTFIQAQPDPTISTLEFSKRNGLVANGLDSTIAHVVLRTKAGGIPFGSVVALSSDATGPFADNSMIDEKGEADIEVYSHRSGTKVMSAVVNGVVELTDTASLVFLFAPISVDGTAASLMGSPAVADLLDYVELVVSVPIIAGGVSREVDVVVSLDGDTNPPHTDMLTPQEQASLHWRIYSSLAKAKPIAVTINGANKTFDPALVATFEPGPAAPEHSSLSFAAERLSAGMIAIVKVRSADMFNNPHAGASVVVTTPAGSTLTPPSPLLLNASGEATASLADAPIATHTIRATTPSTQLDVSNSLYVLRPWSSLDPLGLDEGAFEVVRNSLDQDHVVLYRMSAGTPAPPHIYESNDAGLTYAESVDGLPSTMELSRPAISIVNSDPRRLYLLTHRAKKLYVKDGNSPWAESQVGFPTLSAGEELSHLIAGGDRSDVSYFLVNECIGTCSGPYTYTHNIYRHIGENAGGWTRHPGRGPGVAWPASSGANRLENFFRSQVAPTTATLYSSAYVNSDNQFYHIGVYALPYDQDNFVKMRAPIANVDTDYTLDTSIPESILVHEGQVFRARRIGNSAEIDLSFDFVPNTTESTLFRGIGNHLLLAGNRLSSSLTTLDGYTAGLGWQPFRSFAKAELGFEAVGFESVSPSRTSVFTPFVSQEGATTAVVTPTAKPRFVQGTHPGANIAFLPDRSLIAVRDELASAAIVMSVHDGTRWAHSTRTKGTASLIAGFSSRSVLEIVDGKVLLRNLETDATLEYSVDSTGAALGTALRLSIQNTPLDRRFLVTANGYYSLTQADVTWSKLAPIGGGKTYFVQDPISGDLYTDGNNTHLSHYNGTTWEVLSIPNLNAPLRGLFADPREPGTLYALAGTTFDAGSGIFKKAKGNATWSRYENLSGATTVSTLGFFDSDKAKVHMLAANNTFGVADGVAGSTFSTCAPRPTPCGTSHFIAVDPFDSRRIVVRCVDSSTFYFSENYGRCL